MDVKKDSVKDESVVVKENVIKLEDSLLDYVSGGSAAGKDFGGKNITIFGHN